MANMLCQTMGFESGTWLDLEDQIEEEITSGEDSGFFILVDAAKAQKEGDTEYVFPCTGQERDLSQCRNLRINGPT